MTKFTKVITGSYVGTGVVPQKVYICHRNIRHLEVFSSAFGLDGDPGVIGMVNEKEPTCIIGSLGPLGADIVLHQLGEDDGGAYFMVDSKMNESRRLYGFTALTR